METELKFQVPSDRAARLRKAIATSTARTTRLQAIYVDTVDHRLAAAGLALRLRKEGRVWVQTLKGRGDGLLNRLEHELRLPPQRGEPALDVTRHAGTPAGAQLIATLGGSPLTTLYRTDIQRLHRRVRFQGSLIEIAYDRGWLLAGVGAAQRRLAVDEVEFELLKGTPQTLAVLATKWMSRHGLWWDCRTKSERGMRLALGVDRVPAVTARPPAATTATPAARGLAGWQAELTQALAHGLPNAAEIASDLGSAEHQQQLDLAIARLRQLLRLRRTGPLSEAAQVLAQAWARVAAAGNQGPKGLAFNSMMLGALTLSLPFEGG